MSVLEIGAQLCLFEGGQAPAVKTHCVKPSEATETCFVLLLDRFGILLGKALIDSFEATSRLNCLFSH